MAEKTSKRSSSFPVVIVVASAAICASALLLGLGAPAQKILEAWALPALLCAVAAAVTLLSATYVQRRRLASLRAAHDEEKEKLLRVAELRTSAIEALAMAIDAKDQTTPGHVRRTQVYAVELGKLLNVSDSELEALKAGALLHDVGKLAVPDHILNKPGRLTPSEFEKMKVHAAVGADIIGRVNFPFPVEAVVRYHHERWDGSGYPLGLKGEEIPLVARIISVVDFFDSTRCERPYRAGMTREESLDELRRQAGKSFDPLLVETFVKHIDRIESLIPESELGEQVQPAPSLAASAGGAESAQGAKSEQDAPSGLRSIADAQREVFALYEIAQAVGSSLDLQDTAALVAAKLSSIIKSDACVIFLVDEKTGAAVPAFASGNHQELFSARGIPAGEGVTGWVIANARPMSDASPAIELSGVAPEIASRIKGVMSAPLMREDGSFGAVTLYSESGQAFTAEQTRLLESVCAHVSGALNNALVFERTRESALTDSLTGLPNARALGLMIERRVAESLRLGRGPLALLSMDVDSFKEVNEEFGHGVGDRLLASVASVIHGQLRQMDTLARYSGDEFVAFMPTATAEVAEIVAERIKAAVGSHDFGVKTGRSVRLTLSVGVACHPDDGDSAEELLRAASARMLERKRPQTFSKDPASTASVINMDAFR